MTRNIQVLYGSRDGGSITAEECTEINKDLARLDPSTVPDGQIDNVLDYLEHQFLYRQVSAHLKAQLEDLIEELKLRTR